MKEDAFLSGLVLVIGATGTVGRELLQRLQLGGQRIRAAAREPAVTPDLRDILRREPTSFAQFAGDYARQGGKTTFLMHLWLCAACRLSLEI